MFAISEVAPNAQMNGQSNTQHQVIASVVALQRVIAGQAGAESGDASERNFSGQGDRAKVVRPPVRAKERVESEQRDWTPMILSDASAMARSIIEAQEASLTDQKIVAAFQARHGITDLLSVIRDPDDRLLPRAPQD